MANGFIGSNHHHTPRSHLVKALKCALAVAHRLRPDPQETSPPCSSMVSTTRCWGWPSAVGGPRQGHRQPFGHGVKDRLERIKNVSTAKTTSIIGTILMLRGFSGSSGRCMTIHSGRLPLLDGSRVESILQDFQHSTVCRGQIWLARDYLNVLTGYSHSECRWQEPGE